MTHVLTILVKYMINADQSTCEQHFTGAAAQGGTTLNYLMHIVR